MGIFVNTLGIFFTLFLLFARFFPVLAWRTTQAILKSSGEEQSASSRRQVNTNA